MSPAETTRSEILKHASNKIYEKGYQTTSIDDILENTQVTKGAFYYHFKNKEDMGIALINDLVDREAWNSIHKALSESTDVRRNIYQMFKYLLFDTPSLTIKNGCPTANLVEELASKNSHFKEALKLCVDKWQKAIEAEITRGQANHQLSSAHNAKNISLNIISSYHGARNMGKLYGEDFYNTFLSGFEEYLKQLN